MRIRVATRLVTMLVPLPLFMFACKDGAVDDACAEVFADKGEFFCGASFQSACDALAESPMVVRWSVGWADDSPTDHQLECAQSWLDARSLAGPAGTGLYFSVEASHAQIAELCRAAMIGVCEPEAIAGHCTDLDEAACGADLLCSDIRAMRFVEAQMCVEFGVWAGCIEGGASCPAVEIIAEHADGSCWNFPSGCLPSGGGWTQSDCLPNDADAWPEC
jgi:hypothetical protein